ncbi:MAG: hypothetical protein GY832_35520 [Chloroflexi bacterium]|nr:hypothetical protein [Chloroflexota bacterium]
MGRAIVILLVVPLVIVGLVLLAARDPGSQMPFVTPGTNNDNDTNVIGDLIRLQAEARATSTVAAAQEAGADGMVAAMWQSTAEAQQARDHATAIAIASIEATRQAQAAAAEATKRAEIALTSVAIEKIVVEATIEAGQAQATATAEAQRDQATATARANATSTAVAATATANYVAPTSTAIAADTSAYVAEKTWEARTVPWTTVGKMAFWTALASFFILACVWIFPRAWIAVQMRFLRVDDEADGPQWMFVGTKGLIEAWSGQFKGTSYNSDRDRGPGQTIDPDRKAGLLPGSDPRVTERDQIVDALTRPVQAAGKGNGVGPRRPALPTPRWRHAPVGGPARAYRVLRPGSTLPPQVQRVLDHAVVASLNRDWEERDE